MYIEKIMTLTSTIFILLLSQSVDAQCTAKIADIKHVYDDFENYDSQNNKPARKKLRIRVRDNENCNIHMILKSDNQFQLKSQFQSINYQVKSNSENSISNTRFTFFDSTADVDFFIPAGTSIKSGDYTDKLEFKLLDSENKLLDEKYFKFQENIPARASLSILGYNSNNSNVYLDKLIPGKEYNMLPMFQIITNSNVQLNISSENKGELKNSIYKDKYHVKYMLILNGELLDLRRNFNKRFSYKGRNKFLLNLGVVLSSFKNQAAGEYSDIIRFKIMPINY